MTGENKKTPSKFGGFFRKPEKKDEDAGGMDSPASRHRMTPFKTTPTPYPLSDSEEEQEEDKEEDKEKGDN